MSGSTDSVEVSNVETVVAGERNSTAKTLIIAVSVSVGAVFLCFVALVAFIVYRKRNQRTKVQDYTSGDSSDEDTAHVFDPSTNEGADEEPTSCDSTSSFDSSNQLCRY
mmetsp:Transcript_35270/g.83669  ORF Transcript_35270/g.83669 Transcript_35270/m.83669 type:complete len:109 (+) Transcript_35270:706-1032(+)